VHTTEDATKPPTSGRVAEPEGAYFPDEDLYFFDAQMRGWIVTTMIVFFDAHDDTARSPRE
jgi:hypothetical protein